MTLYLSIVLIVTICSLLHDGDYLPKSACVLIGFLGLCIVQASWVGMFSAVLVSAVFWGVFRRGWQAKAELTALNDNAAIALIPAAYPLGFGFVPMIITRFVVRMPYVKWHRRIQSGLIALLWTAHISAIPALIIQAVGL